MEGEVGVTHMFRLEGLVGRESERVRVIGVAELPGQLPCGYEVDIGAGEPMAISANVARDIVYQHVTLESAAAKLLELCENGYRTFHDAV